MQPIPIERIDSNGLNAPLEALTSLNDFSPIPGVGASRYRYRYENGCNLDALLVNKPSDTLVVSLHGALNREQFTLPRFERLKSLVPYNFSSMYFADPALWLDDRLQLGWYTGWQGADVQSHIAEMITKTASTFNFDKIVLSGSSGGGFAALQIATLIPDSIALAFNPQTSIHGYLIDGKSNAHGAERTYLEVVHPECIVDTIWNTDFGSDWTLKLSNEVSVLRNYSSNVPNQVIYCQTPNDWHYNQHYLPFLAAAARGNNLGKITVHEYGDRHGHHPPTPDEYARALNLCLSTISS